MNHRGPDDWGICKISDKNYLQDTKEDSYAFLGHKRLSILDLSKNGHQPMVYKNLCLVFNGEILNYKNIRKELMENGYRFISNTDTEVLLKGWHFWGEKVLNKLEGMWAFGIYDYEKKTMTVCRDRFGIKPLYFMKTDDSFVFSSEIKPILNISNKSIEPDLNIINHFLFWGNSDWKENCFFKGVKRLQPSSFIKIQFDTDVKIQKFEIEKYYDIEKIINKQRNYTGNIEMAREEYYALLKDSVNMTLEADVPVGSALSGGLDSSSVVSMINELKADSGSKTVQNFQKTFSAVYDYDADCDESFFINELSDFLKVENYKTIPDSKKYNQAIEKFVYHQEEPVGGASVFAGWCVSELTSKHVTVTLDGQGADEYLFGYNYFYGALLKSNMKNPYNLMHLLFKRNNTFDFTKVLKYFLGFAFNKRAEKIFLSRIKHSLNYRGEIPENEYSFFKFKNLNEATVFAFTGLVNLLKYLDRNTMAFSIESRPPFLNRKLVEFSLSLPIDYILKDGWNKYISRISMDKKLPKTITWRKDKKGFPAPEQKWVNSNINHTLERIKSSRILKELPIDLKNIETGNNTNVIFKFDQLAVWEKVFKL